LKEKISQIIKCKPGKPRPLKIPNKEDSNILK